MRYLTWVPAQRVRRPMRLSLLSRSVSDSLLTGVVMFRTSAKAVSVVAAAGILVIGTDFATLTATGDSLILGHVNKANETTVLKKTGAGPALRLNSANEASPALAVNNDAKVRHLNADELDGRTATQLASRAVTFKAGKPGAVVNRLRIWDLPVAVGAYQVSFKAVAIPSTGTPQAPTQLVCGVADLPTLATGNPFIYTAQVATYIGDFPAIISGAEAVRVRSGQQPGVLCTTSSNTAGTKFTLFKPVTVSFTKINAREVRKAERLTTPPGARRAGLLAR